MLLTYTVCLLIFPPVYAWCHVTCIDICCMFVNLSSSICMVSCVTKVGIRELQERIHSAALSAKYPDTHEHVIGMQVTGSYICPDMGSST